MDFFAASFTALLADGKRSASNFLQIGFEWEMYIGLPYICTNNMENYVDYNEESNHT